MEARRLLPLMKPQRKAVKPVRGVAHEEVTKAALAAPHAPVAQRIERVSRKVAVVGSIPTGRAIHLAPVYTTGAYQCESQK